MPGKLPENLLKIDVNPYSNGFLRLHILQIIENSTLPITVKDIQATLLQSQLRVHQKTVYKVIGEILTAKFKGLTINTTQIKTGQPRRGLAHAFFITYNS